MKSLPPLRITDCQVCSNRPASDLCNGDSAIEPELNQIKRTLVYQPGQFVFYEGHAALGLYILCAGRVKLTRSTLGGQQRVVGIVDPGQLIEKHTFQDGALHEATCESMEPSQICVVDRARYLDILEHNAPMAVRVIKMLSREMGVAFEGTDQLAFASARQRLAGLLLELSDRYGETTSQGCRISLQLKREELAQMAAVTVETAVRILKSFHTAQFISINRREITILQPERLARAAR